MKTLTREEFNKAILRLPPMVETASGEDVALTCAIAMNWYDQTIKDGYGYVRITGEYVYIGVETWPGGSNIHKIGGEQ